MLQLAAQMGESLKDAGYTFAIEETHHVTKLDSPQRDGDHAGRGGEKATGVENVPIKAHA